MSFVQKDNSGALFKNDKGGNEKRPDYIGNGQINGRPVRISAWLKDGRNGKFLSLSFTDAPDAPKAPAPRSQPQTNDDMNDEIPF